MKSFQAQTHYELLEISVTANAADVQNAYERLVRLYDEQQVALYGLIDDDQAGALRDRLKLAKDVLSDEAQRDAYDASIGLPPREPTLRAPAAPAAITPPRVAAPPPAPARPPPRPTTAAPTTSAGAWSGGFSYVVNGSGTGSAASMYVVPSAPAAPRRPVEPESVGSPAELGAVEPRADQLRAAAPRTDGDGPRTAEPRAEDLRVVEARNVEPAPATEFRAGERSAAVFGGAESPAAESRGGESQAGGEPLGLESREVASGRPPGVERGDVASLHLGAGLLEVGRAAPGPAHADVVGATERESGSGADQLPTQDLRADELGVADPPRLVEAADTAPRGADAAVVGEPRADESRPAEARAVESRPTESRVAEPRLAEPRAAESAVPPALETAALQSSAQPVVADGSDRASPSSIGPGAAGTPDARSVEGGVTPSPAVPEAAPASAPSMLEAGVLRPSSANEAPVDAPAGAPPTRMTLGVEPGAAASVPVPVAGGEAQIQVRVTPAEPAGQSPGVTVVITPAWGAPVEPEKALGSSTGSVEAVPVEEESALVPSRSPREFRSEPKTKPFEVPAGVEFNGDLLKQVRMARGISLAQVSERTRISTRHLENLESDRYDQLPATVYLRGILMSLSRELGLDGLRVSKSYLAFVEAHRSKD